MKLRVTPFVMALALVLVSCGSATVETNPVATEVVATEALPTPTTAPKTESTDTVGETTPSTEPITFEFAEGSEVRFIIDEELRGSPKTVIGVNKALTGTFVTGPSGSDLLEPATVTIQAGSFVTDEDRRDGAIDRFILDVSTHPEITFTFAEIDGDGMITGVLTIRDISREVTFATTGQAGPDRIEVTGTALVNRTGWGLNIPSVPFVANVSEEVTLEFEFVLEPVD